MATQKLLDLLEFDANAIIDAFKRASLEGQGTPQEIADRREGHFNAFLKKYFPFPYRVTKGNITDVHGKISASVDSLIINPMHPYTIDVGEKFSIILADGVDVAIELKPDISITSELRTALKQAQTVKQLRRAQSPIIEERKYPPIIVEHSKCIPSFIFSIKSKANIVDLIEEINRYHNSNSVPKVEQFDYIVILDCGIVTNHKFLETSPLINSETKEKVTGFQFSVYKKNTLAAFLLLLNSVWHSVATISGHILPRYIRDLQSDSEEYFSDTE